MYDLARVPSAFYICRHLYIYFRVLNPYVYLGPGVYTSPAFIWINTVCTAVLCTHSHITHSLLSIASVCLNNNLVTQLTFLPDHHQHGHTDVLH